MCWKLMLLERSWWAGFNGLYLFGFRMWEILILKWFLPLKIQINSKKIRFLEGKFSWGRDKTWADGTNHTSVRWNKDKTNPWGISYSVLLLQRTTKEEIISTDLHIQQHLKLIPNTPTTIVPWHLWRMFVN
jgi:hypothetical protein